MDNLKTIITFTLPQDANLAKGFLESEGVETYIKDDPFNFASWRENMFACCVFSSY